MTSAYPEPAAAAAISIRGLTKRYGSFTAVDNLSFEVKAGEIFGFLGLNGAGKTTTIRVLLDLLRPTRGNASIFGFDCQGQGLAARAETGYLPGEMGVYTDLTGREVLELLAGLSGRPVDATHRRELQERLELTDSVLRRKLREYSTGMKRKLGLIQAFQTDPHLLILDEPTEGLDPLMQEAFYAILADARQRGRTIFMSSHVLPEVERVCDRIGLLRAGKLVLLATVQETRALASRRVRVFFETAVEPPSALPPGHAAVEAMPLKWELRVEGDLGPLLRLIQSYPVKDLRVDEPALEDVLGKYYRDVA